MDDYRFTRDPDPVADVPWASPEEERAFRLLRDLLIEMRERGRGVSILPVHPGMRAAGFGGFDESYSLDGWAVGSFTASGGDDLAVAESLDQALEAALAVTKVT